MCKRGKNEVKRENKWFKYPFLIYESFLINDLGHEKTLALRKNKMTKKIKTQLTFPYDEVNEKY